MFSIIGFKKFTLTVNEIFNYEKDKTYISYLPATKAAMKTMISNDKLFI